MDESILNSIKKLLNIDPDFSVFDTEISIHINTALADLNQLGVGPANGFSIDDADTTWTAYLGNKKNLNAVKSYVYLRVRLLFDPPTTSFHMDAIKSQLQEMSWRLSVAVEPGVLPPSDFNGNIDGGAP